MSLHDQLLSAIERRRLIRFEYHELPRVAEPHDYGIINGVEQLLVYQVGGESRSKKLPDWRLVRVAEIKQLRIWMSDFQAADLCHPASTRNQNRSCKSPPRCISPSEETMPTCDRLMMTLPRFNG